MSIDISSTMPGFIDGSVSIQPWHISGPISEIQLFPPNTPITTANMFARAIEKESSLSPLTATFLFGGF